MTASRKKDSAGAPAVWFSRGLRFSCVANCGQCCSGETGFVWVTDEEIRAIAARLQCSVKDFAAEYLRCRDGRVSLKEKPNGDCIFLLRPSMGCSIYAGRPTQCRTYPFWPEVLRSPDRWEEEACYCPGVGKGSLHSAESCASKAAETRRSGRATARELP